MLSNLKNVFKIEDLRNKILFTVLMVVVYRFGVAVRVPGIDSLAVDPYVLAGLTVLGVAALLRLRLFTASPGRLGPLPRQLS